MKKELTFEDLSPRSDVIYKLERKLERFTKRLKETKYEKASEMLDDLIIWESIEKDIEVQKCYYQVEESYWNS